jgi:hypothetical protein
MLADVSVLGAAASTSWRIRLTPMRWYSMPPSLSGGSVPGLAKSKMSALRVKASWYPSSSVWTK